MWNGAFKYEPDVSKAYTMWFFDENNPNGAVTDALSSVYTQMHTYTHTYPNACIHTRKLHTHTHACILLLMTCKSHTHRDTH